jgi:hypothetical protein
MAAFSMLGDVDIDALQIGQMELAMWALLEQLEAGLPLLAVT